MKYRHHKYTWSKPFGSVRHQWEFVGRHGAMHFHASIPEKQNSWVVSAGLEIHYMRPPAHMNEDPPSQTECWILHCPCWHEGTSLYASETLWPMIEPMLRHGDHESIFRILEQDADERFSQFFCGAA